MLGVDELFSKTEYVVESTYEECYFLWCKYSNEAMLRHEQNRYIWVQHNPGRIFKVGEFGGEPVNVQVWWNYINGRLIMFYEPISNVVNWEMVRKWVKNKCNHMRRAHTNAGNFHSVIQYI